jgi:hypothetical protein
VASIDITSPQAGNYLLQLFTDNVARTLRAKAIEAINPAIDAAVAKAVESLRPEIEIHFNHARQQVGALVITHEVIPHA